MTVNVNNQSRSFSDNSSVYDLLNELGITTTGIAVAINNAVISRELWAQTSLKQDDSVTIIQATQGG